MLGIPPLCPSCLRLSFFFLIAASYCFNLFTEEEEAEYGVPRSYFVKNNVAYSLCISLFLPLLPATGYVSLAPL